MIQLDCPKCGRGGSIPHEKLNTRLVCKKCHAVFHMPTADRTVLGEPQVESPKADASARAREPRRSSGDGVEALTGNFSDGIEGLKESLSSISPKQAGIGAAGLLLVVGAWFFLSRPPESLTEITALTVRKFADDDLASLKQAASTDTVEDVVKWYETVHPRLVKARERWKTNSVRTDVLVLTENAQQRSGESHAYVYPASASTPQASTTSGSEPVWPLIIPLEFTMHWTLDAGGNWRINGRQTLQSAGPEPIEASFPQ